MVQVVEVNVRKAFCEVGRPKEKNETYVFSGAFSNVNVLSFSVYFLLHNKQPQMQ